MDNNVILNLYPFRPLILKLEYSGFDKNVIIPVCEDFLGKTEKNSYLEFGEAKSSVTNPVMPHLLPEFRDFYEWLFPKMMIIFRDAWFFNDDYEFYITNSWVNLHKKGGFTQEHLHSGCHMVVSTYLDIPEDSGFIEFKDPMEIYYHNHDYTDGDITGEIWKPIETKTNDVLIFPGWIKHRTQENKTDKDRWVLTTNVVGVIKTQKPTGPNE